MTTAVQPAKREQPMELGSAPLSLMPGNTHMPHGAHRPAANDSSYHAPGIDAQDFVRDNRIHVKDGSLFIDPYLVIHPRELDPKNEARLREKLRLTYSVNNPSFYESNERLGIALNLSQLLPVGLAAQNSRLTNAIKEYNAQVDSGVDAKLKRDLEDRQHPFAAIVRDTIQQPAKDPVGIEMLKNGVGIYLLLREKLTKLGYLNPLASYITHAGTPDQVLADLADKIGVTPLAVREAALKGGLDGVGHLLGLDTTYIADVKSFTEHAATQDFSLNLIEHWHLGRQLLKGQPSSLEQKLETGIAARVEAKIDDARKQVRYHFDVPEPVKAEEKRIAEALNLLEPIQREVMYKLGYEICYTPEITADGIAKYPGIYGLHRKAGNNLRDVHGTYRIYFAGRGNLKESMRTMVHEVAHNLWPEQFSSEDVKKIDALAISDQQRFAAFNRIMDEKFPEFEKFLRAYQAGSDAEKAAIVQTTKQYFAPYGVSIDEGVLPYLRDANDFRFLVKHAVDTLSVEGARYARSGYESPHERFREVLSRFAELKQVELRGEPQLLQFLAPGLNQIWETHYIPHLARVNQQLDAKSAHGHAAPTPVKMAADVSAPQDAAPAPVAQNPKGSPVAPLPVAACAADVPQPLTSVGGPAQLIGSVGIAPALSVLSSIGGVHSHA